MVVFPPLLTPLYWERPGNIPPLTRLLQVGAGRGWGWEVLFSCACQLNALHPQEHCATDSQAVFAVQAYLSQAGGEVAQRLTSISPPSNINPPLPRRTCPRRAARWRRAATCPRCWASSRSSSHQRWAQVLCSTAGQCPLAAS